MTKAVNQLVSSLGNATEADLQALRSQIAELETELANNVAERRKTIDSLEALAKIVDLRLHGKPARKKPQPRKAKAAATQESEAVQELDATRPKLRDLIYDLLLEEGSMPADAIAARLGVAPVQVSMSVGKTNWFTKRNGEIAIGRARETANN